MQNYATVFVANGYILLVWLTNQMMPNWYNLSVQDPLGMQTSRNEFINDFWHIIEIWGWICSAALRFLIITGIHISCAWHNSIAVMSYTKFCCDEREKNPHLIWISIQNMVVELVSVFYVKQSLPWRCALGLWLSIIHPAPNDGFPHYWPFVRWTISHQQSPHKGH